VVVSSFYVLTSYSFAVKFSSTYAKAGFKNLYGCIGCIVGVSILIATNSHEANTQGPLGSYILF
jgi:hypothetical protein